MFKGNNLHVLVDQVSGLVQNFYIGVFSDTVNVILKLCMMVLQIELSLFVILSVTLTFFKVTTVSNSFN